MKICLATNNKGKIAELKQLLSDSDFEIVGLKEIGCDTDLPETQNTFEGNSLQKAEYVYNHFHMACIADDSGLEVDALHGEPGVFSARYAGKHGDDAANTALVLSKMQGIENRQARFVTVIAYIDADGNKFTFEGKVEGILTNQTLGTGGFGYDPIFIPKGYEQTFAQLQPDIKNTISHRAQAMRRFLEFLGK